MQVLEAKHLFGFKGSESSIAEYVCHGLQRSVLRTSGNPDYQGLCFSITSLQGSEPWHKVSES